jgi:ABC-type multidrug transport system fused ATPase/permease subunit
MAKSDGPASISERTNGSKQLMPLLKGLAQIYAHVSKSRRRQFFVVLALMFVGAFAELATIGSVLPFLTLLAQPDTAASLPFAELLSAFGGDPLIAAALLFGGFAILAGMVRLQLSWSTQDFAYHLGNDLTVAVERRIVRQPYGFHIQHNSSRFVAALVKVEILVFEVLLPSMQAFIAAFMAIFIIAALVYIDPLTAMVAAVLFSAIYFGVSAAAGKRLARNSEVIARSFDERTQIAQESLGGIRDLIIDDSHETYLEQFQRVNLRLNLARANTAFIAVAPRFVIETIGIVIIAAIAVVIARTGGGISAALPILGAIALGAQRLLPLLQQIYSGSSLARGQRAILGEIVELLELPQPEETHPNDRIPLPYKDRICVNQVSFSYPRRRNRALDNISLEIPSGSSVALVGETGSGKSTLADLLMGLLEPDSGSISVDGAGLTTQNRRRWQRSIAHVPQSIFLADTTISRNIALSIPRDTVDMERVIEASKKAQLQEFVESLPDGYETLVGEHGIRLSGGQRQRLGIARAIYKEAPVLVLDEATSALDEVTEAAVMRSLEELRAKSGRTLILIAHRLSTVAKCEIVARLQEGRLVELGTFSQVIGGSTRRARPKSREA